MRQFSIRHIFIALVLIFLLMSCAGARPKVRLDAAKYPVSMSTVVLDQNGNPLPRSQQEQVGQFKAKIRAAAMGYSFLPLNPCDFSEELNKQVEAVNGEAVVNYEVATRIIPCNFIEIIQWSQSLPIFVGCVDVYARGEIIRARKTRPAPSSQ